MIPSLIAQGIFPSLVDEFMVEIHFHHPKMAEFGWNGFPHSLEEARALMMQLREIGVHAHYWP